MSAPLKAPSFRGDLEGIRGIALVIILFTHLIEWPTGGFVALDTFFVLSGYLITGLLLREYRLTGTISLIGFYRRRIRRLMPSAMLVLAATCLLALGIFITSRAVSTLWDAFWSLLLVSNWNFALNGTDYFATSLPQSPLLHFWSLSVEEQFYLFWPALVLALLGLGAVVARKRAAARRHEAAAALNVRPLVVGLAILGAASFVWGVVQADLNPQISYLSTLTRIWELAAGALLCFVGPLAARIPSAVRPVLAWGGLVAILVCTFIYTPSLHYPGFWCLVPVGATMLIIVAGIGGNGHLVATTNPVSRYLGKISYTAYLWHWPIFIFAGVLFGKESAPYLYGALPLSLVLAALTTHFVEDPIRLSNWLEPAGRSRRRHSSRERARRLQIGITSAGVAVALSLVAIIVFAPRGPGTDVSVASAVDPNTVSATDAPTSLVTEQQRLAADITAGLSATSWPSNLSPSLDDLGEKAWAPQWTKDKCLDTSESNVDSCIYGDASLGKTAVLLGDSSAISYMPGLQPALNALGYRVHVLTHAQCPFANVQVLGQSPDGTPAPGFPGACDVSRKWSIDKTVALNPDLVIVTDGESESGAMVIQGDDARRTALQTGLVDSLTQLKTVTGTVAVLAAAPQTVSLQECATRLNVPSDCTRFINDDWFKLLKGDTDAAVAVTGVLARPVQVVDTSTWFCSADRSACPAFAGLTPVLADGIHITSVYSANLQTILQLTFQAMLSPPA